eukprot:15443141-Alexandrium_andersonii.AAC.1
MPVAAMPIDSWNPPCSATRAKGGGDGCGGQRATVHSRTTRTNDPKPLRRGEGIRRLREGSEHGAVATNNN